MTRAERHEQVVALKDSGLKFREIAAQLGLAMSTVTAAYYDPTGEKDHARRHRADGQCVDCGARTHNGGAVPPERCAGCLIEQQKTDPAYAAKQRAHHLGRVKWTDEQIFAAIRRSARAGVASTNAYSAMHAANPAASPSLPIILRRFDRWAVVVELAGVAAPGARRSYVRTRDDELLACVRACAAAMGRRPTVTEYRAWARENGGLSCALIRNRLGGWLPACERALADGVIA